MTTVDMDDVMPNNNQPPRRFVDRQIPIGVMVVVCLQILTGVWFFSAQNSTIKQLADHASAQDARLDKVDDRTLNIEKSVAILKDRSDENVATSHRIEEYLHSTDRRR